MDCHPVGYLRQPIPCGQRDKRLPTRIPWAADTGIYGNPDFKLEKYLSLLESWVHMLDTCLFATAPDVVGDWAATLNRSQPVLARIRQIGYPVALVTQDGATVSEIPWDDIDGIFTGGSTSWKLSEDAFSIITEANRRNIWTHMGRVNSWRRIKAAMAGGYKSVDGTYVAFGPDLNSVHIVNWIGQLKHQPPLLLEGTINGRTD